MAPAEEPGEDAGAVATGGTDSGTARVIGDWRYGCWGASGDERAPGSVLLHAASHAVVSASHACRISKDALTR